MTPAILLTLLLQATTPAPEVSSETFNGCVHDHVNFVGSHYRYAASRSHARKTARQIVAMCDREKARSNVRRRQDEKRIAGQVYEILNDPSPADDIVDSEGVK